METLPVVKSFLMADSVFQQRSGKWCIVGVFDRILARKYPTLHYSLGLFLTLSDAYGEYEVRVEFCDSNDRPLSIFPGIHMEVKDKLATVNFGLQTYNLLIPSPGTYFFKLFFNNRQVGQDIRLGAELLETLQNGEVR